jgi:hypothetical protein
MTVSGAAAEPYQREVIARTALPRDVPRGG